MQRQRCGDKVGKEEGGEEGQEIKKIFIIFFLNSSCRLTEGNSGKVPKMKSCIKLGRSLMIFTVSVGQIVAFFIVHYFFQNFLGFPYVLSDQNLQSGILNNVDRIDFGITTFLTMISDQPPL